VYWTRKNEAENAEFSKITSRKQNLKAARNEKLSSRRSANSPMPSGCAIPILKPGVFQQNRYLSLGLETLVNGSVPAICHWGLRRLRPGLPDWILPRRMARKFRIQYTDDDLGLDSRAPGNGNMTWPSIMSSSMNISRLRFHGHSTPVSTKGNEGNEALSEREQARVDAFD